MGKRYIAEDGSPAERRMHLFRIPWRRGRVRTAASLGDSLFQWLSGGVAVAVVGSLALIVAVLFVLADESIRTFGVGFLNGTTWNPLHGGFGSRSRTWLNSSRRCPPWSMAYGGFSS